MELLLGQISTPADDTQVRMALEMLLGGEGLPLLVRRIVLPPLEWAIAIQLPEFGAEDTPHDNQRLVALLTMVQKTVDLLGEGRYYARVVESGPLEDFWDSGLLSLALDPDVAHGLPLCVDQSREHTVFGIPIGWVHEYILRHYSNQSLEPRENLSIREDRLRIALNAVSFLLAAEGDWRFEILSPAALPTSSASAGSRAPVGVSPGRGQYN